MITVNLGWVCLGDMQTKDKEGGSKEKGAMKGRKRGERRGQSREDITP